MSILTHREKSFEALYMSLKELVERRKRVGSNLNVGLDSSDGRYARAEDALINAGYAMKEIADLGGFDVELYRR